MFELNLKDIWRVRNPTKREYSCHSTSHNTFSCIDYFLISNFIVSKVKDCIYKSILISDHALILLKYSALPAFKGQTAWHLKPLWQQNPKFLEYVGTNMEDYFVTNTNETSASIRWEAFKAFIRGQMMGYTRNALNKQHSQMIELEGKIKELELESQINNTKELQQELAILKAKYHEISTNKALAGLTRLKQTYWDQGEKAGKLLAWHIKMLQNERAIDEITNTNRENTTDPQKINKLFESYYRLLYTSESQANSETLCEFFDHIKIASLSEEVRAELDSYNK